MLKAVSDVKYVNHKLKADYINHIFDFRQTDVTHISSIHEMGKLMKFIESEQSLYGSMKRMFQT